MGYWQIDNNILCTMELKLVLLKQTGMMYILLKYCSLVIDSCYIAVESNHHRQSIMIHGYILLILIDCLITLLIKETRNVSSPVLRRPILINLTINLCHQFQLPTALWGNLWSLLHKQALGVIDCDFPVWKLQSFFVTGVGFGLLACFEYKDDNSEAKEKFDLWLVIPLFSELLQW